VPQCVGVVLSGGAGRRLQRGVKGELEIGGVALAERAARVLWPFCGSVLISIAPGASNPAPRYRTVEDRPPAGRGPLAGILAAFEATGTADLLVLACDYPGVDGSLIQCLMAWTDEGHDLVMPTDSSGRDHPLVAWWSRRVEPRVREALAQQRHKVRSLLFDCRVKRLSPSELPVTDIDRALFNVNRPEDLAWLGDRAGT
jgi:molybdopterin-guanine dinucleotide biosynthesis protein A